MPTGKGRKAVDTIPGLSKDLARFMEDLQKESDRGAALVAAAYLDDTLALLIRAALIDDARTVGPLFEYPGELSTLASRTKFAYAMGLIGPAMRGELNLIRDIRNKFSHSHRPASFDDPSIRTDCLSIRSKLWEVATRAPDPRSRFLVGAVLLAQELLLRGLGQKHAPPGRDFKMSDRLDFDHKGR